MAHRQDCVERKGYVKQVQGFRIRVKYKDVMWSA